MFLIQESLCLWSCVGISLNCTTTEEHFAFYTIVITLPRVCGLDELFWHTKKWWLTFLQCKYIIAILSIQKDF